MKGLSSDSHRHGAESSRGPMQLVLLGAACLAVGGWCIRETVAQAASAGSLRERTNRASALMADADRIETLRSRPQEVAASPVPESRLLDDITAALKSAPIDAAALVSTVPQPPRPVARTNLVALSHRLVFQKVRLEPL